jgi:protein-tyrosine phosphatase
MFDLHNHCLPGLDDGALDWEESLAMARIAVEDGIEGVVCTPHWARGLFENNRNDILSAVAAFKGKLEAHKIPLRVYPGSEILLDFDLYTAIEAGEILTINDSGRFVLIELTPEVLPLNIDHLFWELQTKQIRPIISHPERNRALWREPERLYKWTEMGVLAQVTAASLLGGFGDTVQGFTQMLLKHRMAHVIATDSHGPGMRPPRLSRAFEAAAKIVGEETASLMVRENPMRIIHGEAVSVPEPVPLKGADSGASFWNRSFSFLKRSPRHY